MRLSGHQLGTFPEPQELLSLFTWGLFSDRSAHEVRISVSGPVLNLVSRLCRILPGQQPPQSWTNTRISNILVLPPGSLGAPARNLYRVHPAYWENSSGMHSAFFCSTFHDTWTHSEIKEVTFLVPLVNVPAYSCSSQACGFIYPWNAEYCLSESL